MSTKATPKFRLSFSQEQLDLLYSSMCAYRDADNQDSQTLLFFKTLETLKAYASGARHPAYVASGEKPGRKATPAPTAADLLEPVKPAATLEECAAQYRTYLSFYKPMLDSGVTVPAELAAAVSAWESYCCQNDLNPEEACHD